MKILLFGKNGQIGWELCQILKQSGDVIAPERKEADLSRPESLKAVIRNNKPDVIVNAAAYTAVDKAETDELLATTVNSTAPGIIAEEAKRLNVLLIHYSTDYVFDGSKRSPYLESDTPNPLNVYGRTKLAGEAAIHSSGCDYLIFRTSWIYAARGENFLLKLLSLAAEKRELNIIDDQTGCPTWAKNVAEITRDILHVTYKQRLSTGFRSGIYNIVSAGETSWLEFAREIVRLASSMGLGDGFVVDRINAISSESYMTAARRPQYSVLSTGKIKKTFGISPAEWTNALQSCMESMK